MIPVFNGAGTIGDQLDALARQTHRGPWQVVVADNGSSDRTVAVVESRRRQLPDLRVVDASQRRGPSYARNVGTRASDADLVLYCDADDVVTPGWMAAMAAAASRFDLLGAARGTRPLTEGQSGDLEGVEGVVPAPDKFRFLPWVFGGGCGVRREAFERVGGWSEDQVRGEDVDFCWRVQLAGYRMGFVPDAVVLYRQRDDLRARVRQQFGFGAYAPVLYRRFAAAGADPRPLGVAARSWARLLAGAPLQPFRSRPERLAWAGAVAGHVGRAWGSVRHRTVCL